MFGWNNKLNRKIEYLEDTVHQYCDRYWHLRYAHERLLKHLGLTEEVVREHTILKKIKEG